MLGSLGIPEVIFIFVIALLVFGPRRLPEIGRTLGRALGEFRRATTDLKRTFDAEAASIKEVARPVVTPEPVPEPASDSVVDSVRESPSEALEPPEASVEPVPEMGPTDRQSSDSSEIPAKLDPS